MKSGKCRNVKNDKDHVGVGRGFPPPHKSVCYTLVGIKKVGLGSIQEFIGWPHRDAQRGLVLLVWDQRQ